MKYNKNQECWCKSRLNKSVCISVNDEVCHGILGNRVLKSGDIVNVDATTNLNGYFADASRMFMIGDVKEEDKNKGLLQ